MRTRRTRMRSRWCHVERGGRAVDAGLGAGTEWGV